MDKLPNEVLNVIFTLLHQHDKVESMLVCRRWWNFINLQCLFHTLQFSDKSNYNSFISHSNQSLRAQTERLVSFFELNEGFDFTSLFPNLPMVFLQKPCPILNQVPQQQCLEHIVENATHFFTSEVLLRGMCPNLTKIVVSATINSSSATQFIRLFKHSPNLKHLSMTSFQLFFMQDIELLHRTVPTLESVAFLYSTLESEATQVVDIVPALTVTVFRIGTRFSSLSTPMDLLDYMVKKYPNMVELQAHNFLRNSTVLDVENRFFQLLKALPLHTISIDMTQPTPELFTLLDEARCQIGNIRLDSDMNTLDMWHKVALSHQVNYIHTLKLEHISFNDDFYHVLLKQLYVLKNLVLEPKSAFLARRKGAHTYSEKVYPTIWLDKIFLCCPSKVLDSLTIQGCNLDVNTDTCSTLKRLVLSYMELPKTFDDYVSTSLPHLKHLALTHCGILEKEFCLPNHHLSTFEVTEGVDPRTSRLLVINGKEERLRVVPMTKSNEYSFKKQHVGNDNSILPYYLKVSKDSTNMVPDIVLICDYIDNIIFFTY